MRTSGRNLNKPLPSQKNVLSFFLLLAYLLLATLYSIIVPAFEAPDENGHFYYIIHLLTAKSLPHQLTSNYGEAHQPPFYYILASIAAMPADVSDPTGAFRPNPQFSFTDNRKSNINAGLHGSGETFPYRGQALALHLSRFVSILLSAGTVFLIIRMGWKIFPDKPAIGLLAAGLAAFNPQFLFIGSVINNDNLLFLLSTAAWLLMLQIIEHPEQGRNWLLAGVLCALALLTKLNGLLIGLVFGLILLTIGLKLRSFRLFTKGALWFVLPVVILTGWWFIRNHLLYGDPLGWKVYTQVFAANQRQVPFTASELVEVIKTQFYSSWGVFGWMNLRAPGWFFMVVSVVFVLSAAGWLIYLRKGSWKRPAGMQRFLAWLVIVVVAQELLVLFIIQGCNTSCHQGRYLFPAVGPFMILLGFGLITLFDRYSGYLAPALVLLFFTIAVITPLWVIKPAYPSPTISKWGVRQVQNQTSVNFNQQVELRGYDYHPKKGELIFYWQVLKPLENDYSVNMRLLDQAGTVILEKNRAPGNKAWYPPKLWLPEDIIADRYILNLPRPLSPGRYQIQLSIFFDSNQLPLRVVQADPSGSDHATLPLQVPIDLK